MTDNDIIKALECCANNGDCEDCAINPHRGNYGYCTSLAIKTALDLIKRQKAEIERLESYNENLLAANVGLSCGLLDEIKTARAEAIKEFAERVETVVCANTYPSFDKEGKPVNVWKANDGYRAIDNLVKQMTEGV